MGGDTTDPPTSPTKKTPAPPVASKPKKGSVKNKSMQVVVGDSPSNDKKAQENEEKDEDKDKTGKTDEVHVCEAANK